jgi:hypothetical protein
MARNAYLRTAVANAAMKIPRKNLAPTYTELLRGAYSEEEYFELRTLIITMITNIVITANNSNNNGSRGSRGSGSGSGSYTVVLVVVIIVIVIVIVTMTITMTIMTIIMTIIMITTATARATATAIATATTATAIIMVMITIMIMMMVIMIIIRNDLRANVSPECPIIIWGYIYLENWIMPALLRMRICEEKGRPNNEWLRDA